MRIIARRTLREFWEGHPDSEQQLRAWFAEAKLAEWQNPNEIKQQYGNASILKDGRVVFNVCGNDYRLVVWINYESQTIFIRCIDTHEEYDKINAEEI
jgi:mRNA interferase HigB